MGVLFTAFPCLQEQKFLTTPPSHPSYYDKGLGVRFIMLAKTEIPSGNTAASGKRVGISIDEHFESVESPCTNGMSKEVNLQTHTFTHTDTHTLSHAHTHTHRSQLQGHCIVLHHTCTHVHLLMQFHTDTQTLSMCMCMCMRMCLCMCMCMCMRMCM